MKRITTITLAQAGHELTVLTTFDDGSTHEHSSGFAVYAGDKAVEPLPFEVQQFSAIASAMYEIRAGHQPTTKEEA